MRSSLHYQIHRSEKAHPWVVFLHGAGGSIATWNFQIEAFRPNFNLLLIDLRDHGQSKQVQPSYERYNFDIVSKDIVQVLEKEQIERAHFITLSFGSVLMQALFKRKPAVVDRIVFIGGIFNANSSIKIFVHLARFLNLFLTYPMMYRIFSYLLMPKKEQQFARRVYQQQARKLGADEYIKWLGLYSEFFLLLKSFHRQEIDNKMLVLMGEDDYLFLPSAHAFAKSKMNAELQLVPMAGHICNIDQSQFTNEAILSFLNEGEILSGKQGSIRSCGTN